MMFLSESEDREISPTGAHVLSQPTPEPRKHSPRQASREEIIVSASQMGDSSPSTDRRVSGETMTRPAAPVTTGQESGTIKQYSRKWSQAAWSRLGSHNTWHSRTQTTRTRFRESDNILFRNKTTF